MLIGFFFTLKEHRVPVTIREFLTLLEAMKRGLAHGSVDEFYFLARAALVKDEANFDRYDRAFGAYFKGLESLDDALAAAIPRPGCAGRRNCCSRTRTSGASRRSADGTS